MPSRFAGMAVRVDTKVRELVLKGIVGDADRLHLGSAAAQMMDAPSWRDATAFEGDEVRGSAPRTESGDELPGSWHQYANGGVRRWTTASGEIEAT